MSRALGVALGLVGSIALAGCEDGGRQSAPAPVRPVLSVVAKLSDQTQIGFAGTIEPRYRTDRSFQVLGRILSRSVDVGDAVRKGQPIAQNDPLFYQLAVRGSEASLLSAKAQLEKTEAQKQRTSRLVQEKVSSQAELDAAQQALDAAAASVRQADAALAKSREQLGYTTLTADIDGVVTAVSAQVGQTASPGVTVMTLARIDVREAVVDMPEKAARALGVGAPFEIRLQAKDEIRMSGKVREIAPEADAATRLRRIKITLDRSVDPFRLGSTITATPLVATTGGSTVDIPASALFERDGATRVWVVDPDAKAVRSAPVEVAERGPRVVRIASGIEPGARIVVAGARSLAEGQAVKLDPETDR